MKKIQIQILAFLLILVSQFLLTGFANSPQNDHHAKEKITPLSYAEVIQSFRCRPVPDSLLHGLRLLSASGGMIRIDHSKSETPVLPAGIEPIADNLTNSVGPSFDFKVYDYAMYPYLAWADNRTGHQKAFDGMLARVISESDYYFLIGIQLNPTEVPATTDNVDFRIALKLPRTGDFIEVNDLIEAQIQDEVMQAILKVQEEKGYAITAIKDAEMAALETLNELVEQLKSNTFNTELTEKMLQNNDFVPVIGEPVLLTHTGTNILGVDGIYDYAGLQRSGTNIWEEFQAANPGLPGAVTVKYIITSDYEYGSGSNNEFQTASELYESSTEKMVLWFHFHKPDSPEGTSIPYLKFKNNLTEAEIKEYYEGFLWDNYKAKMAAGGASAKSNGAESGLNSSISCPGFEFSHTWRAKTGLLDCIESPAAWLTDPEFEPIYNLLIGENSAAQWGAGFYCGLLDGLLDQVDFLYEAGVGLVNYARYSVESPSGFTIPTSITQGITTFGPWIADIVYKSFEMEVQQTGIRFWEWDIEIKSFDLETGFTKHREGAIAYWAKMSAVYEAFTKADTWGALFSSIKQALSSSFKDLTLQNGLKENGYAVGKVVINIILDLATGGSSLVVDMVQVSANSLQKIGRAIVNKNLSTLIGDAVQALTPSRQFLCRYLASGCFVGKTLVSTSDGKIPIMEIYPNFEQTYNTTWVKTYTIDPDVPYFTASKTNLFPDSESWNWVSLEISEKDKPVLIAHLLRPKGWLELQNAYGVGDIIWLNLPEMSVSGLAKITGINACKINQDIATLACSENGYVFKPVTGWFEQNDKRISSFVFSNGDTIQATNNHLFYSVDRNEFVPVGDLSTGEKVKIPEGEELLVSKSSSNISERVYNLEVWGNHNFLVGKSAVLVHNSCASIIAEQLGVDLNKLIKVKLPLGKQTYKRVFMNEGGEISHKEAEFFDKIGDIIDEDFVLPFKGNQPAVDGFIKSSGKPIQLKQLKGATPSAQQRAIIEHSESAYDSAVKAEKFSNIDVHIEAPLITKSEASSAWQFGTPTKPPYSRPSDHYIDKIIVHCSDGYIQLK